MRRWRVHFRDDAVAYFRDAFTQHEPSATDERWLGLT